MADFMDERNCSYTLSKTINVYEKSLVYIGDPLDEFTTGFKENFKENDILFDHILLPEKSTFSEDEISSSLSTHIDFLKTADWIVLNSSNFDVVLQVISKINGNTNLEL
ncbi:hypothetical protein KKG31_01440 [Patescibacteria group bacterium]|nr:hypothetical protein [Patescibacteria group bacterium]MBU1757841.1 hypothetical protein [Patescibacteria group bacterium]